jgi:hypothetical protein
MLNDLVCVQDAMRLWSEDEPKEVIERMVYLLASTYGTPPQELPLRTLLGVLDNASGQVNRTNVENSIFIESLEMTSDP